MTTGDVDVAETATATQSLGFLLHEDSGVRIQQGEETKRALGTSSQCRTCQAHAIMRSSVCVMMSLICIFVHSQITFSVAMQRRCTGGYTFVASH